jgi:hypothetical protein
VAELFFKCVNGIKFLIIARNRQFNTLMNSTFLLLFWPEVFEKQPLCKDNVCGRIFSLAAELFGEFGRQHLPEVGNTGIESNGLERINRSFQVQWWRIRYLCIIDCCELG